MNRYKKLIQIQTRLRKLLSLNLSGTIPFEDVRRVIFLSLLLLSLLIFAFISLVYFVLIGQGDRIALQLVLIAGISIVYFLIWVTKKYQLFSILLIVGLALNLGSKLLLTPHPEHIHYEPFLFPVIVLFLTGRRLGSVILFILITGYAFLLFSLGSDTHTPFVNQFMIITLILVVLFFLFYEFSIQFIVKSFYRKEEELKSALENLSKNKESLRELETLKAMGHLAGGVAHDFNNIISTMKSINYIVKSRYSAENTDIQDFVSNTEAALHRSAQLTRQLLTYARKQEYNKQPVVITDFFKRLHTILAGTLDKRIELEIQIPDRSLRTELDATQFMNACLNLALNAQDAMKDGGKLTFKTEKCSEAKILTIFKDHEFQSLIKLSVIDTGVGMSEAVKNRIFEPFFTTKRDSNAIGLGLSMVEGIVNAHSGIIITNSNPGAGTRFDIYLPVFESETIDQAGEPEDQAGEPKDQVTEQKDSILVIMEPREKSQPILNFLEKLNLKVINVQSLKEVESILKKKTQIKGVILEITSEQSGYRMYELIQKIRPSMPVFLLTEEPGSGIVKALIQNGVLGVFRYTVNQSDFNNQIRFGLAPD